MNRSVELWLMSRSCHSAMFSRATSASARSSRAIPVTRSARTGLRLCGIALLPCCPEPNGSNASPTSVRWRWRISTAIRSSVPPRMASVVMSSACRSRLTTWVGAGSTESPSSVSTCRSTSALTFAWVPTAPEIEPTLTASRARARRSASRWSSASQPAALKPNVIGSAWMPWRAPDHRRLAMLDRQASDDLDEPGQLVSHDAGRVSQHDRGGRVEDVGARQPVVEPAPLRPEALGDRAQEGDDVVLRLPLDLARTIRVDLADLAPDALVVGLRHHTGFGEGLERQQLDPQPQLELVAFPEDLAQLRQRVAIDHVRGSTRSSALPACSSRKARTRSASAASERARIRAARCAAFRAPALPIATVATGTPGGICTTA